MESLSTLQQLGIFYIKQTFHNCLILSFSKTKLKGINYMQKILFGLALFLSSLFAELSQIDVTPEFIKETKLKIIDIRTKSEWIETGIVKGSYTITFFDEKGDYNIELFLDSLDKIVKKGEKFALICRTGSRTGMISEFLGKKLDYNVVNLRGGIKKLFIEGFKSEKYGLSKKQ
jgi:rhodanese-related sulfurtransferase